MKRHLFNFTAAVSLALLVCAVAMWVWTATHYRIVRFSRGAVPPGGAQWQCIDFAAHRGLAQVARMMIRSDAAGAQPSDAGWRVETDDSPGVNDFFVGDRRLGFGFEDAAWRVGPNARRRTTAVVIPLWFALLAFAVLPTLWARAAIRRAQRGRRRRRGYCEACGYDLRGSSERCPECGIVPLMAREPKPERAP